MSINSDASWPADETALPEGDLPLVPLFPLPNVVLFPGAVLPLHIFEERYKAMTRHAIEGERLIAMALLRPGWEKCYYAKPAIDPVVCVGSILSHEQLPDGKYNFLLRGMFRCRIVREISNEPYRLAKVEQIFQKPVSESQFRPERQRLIDMFTSLSVAGMPIAPQFVRLLASKLPTPDVADLVAFNFLEDVGLKQALLGEADAAARVRKTIAALELACAATQSQPSAVQIAAAACSTSRRRFSEPGLN